jgi:predicted phosphodiesterase
MSTLAGVRIAAITDIHANLPALEAVLGAIEDAGAEEIWCLGDVLGYGVEPDACAALIRERCAVTLVGNHDLAVLGALDIDSFSEAAALAVEWTQANVSEETLDFLRELDPQNEREGIGLFHASPRDPIWEYVLSSEQADAGIDANPRPIGLIGHSHVALFFSRPDGGSRDDTRGAPAASASHATAIRARPGSSSTPRRRPRAFTASPTRSGAPRRRSQQRACRAASPTASTPASDAQMQGKYAPEVVL